jgi:hypothetical protein
MRFSPSPERSPLHLAQEPARIYAVGNVPGRRLGGAAAAGQRVLIDEDLTGNMLGQRRVAESRKCLQVQPGGMTLINVSATSRAGPRKDTNRAVLNQSQHGNSAHLGGAAVKQALSATEVRSGHQRLPRAKVTDAGGDVEAVRPRRCDNPSDMRTGMIVCHERYRVPS